MRLYLDPAVLIHRISTAPTGSRVRQQLHEAWWVGDLIATSSLGRTELRRLGERFGVPQAVIADAFAGVDFIAVSEELLAAAAGVGSAETGLLSALHVASALRIEADYALTADPALAELFTANGISVRNLH